MPSGMDMVRQDMQDAKPRVEVQETRPDNDHMRPGGLQYPRGDEVVRDSVPAKTSNYWNQKAPERRHMSSSSDDDFMYMKDLNLTQSAAGGISTKGIGADRKQVIGAPRNDYYNQPLPKDRMDLTPGSGVPLNVRDPAQTVDGPMLGSKGELSEASSGQVRHRQQLQVNEQPYALPRLLANTDASRTPASQAALGQKLSGPTNSYPYPTSGPDSRYAHSPEQNLNSADRDMLSRQVRGSEQKPLNISTKHDAGANAEFFRNGNQSTAKNSEAEVLNEIRNSSNRLPTGETSRMQGMPEVRYGPASSSAFDRSLNESRTPNPSEKLTSGSEGSMREKGSEASSGKVDEWSVKRLAVQKPLSRVEEWTLEQMRQQQEIQSRNDGRPDRDRNSNFDPRYQRQLESQVTTASTEPIRVSPDRTNPPITSNSFGGVGVTGPVPMPRKQLQGNQMQRNQLPGNQLQSSEMQSDELRGSHMHGNQLPRSQVGNWLPGNQIQINQGNQLERGQIQGNQRSHLPGSQKQQTSVMENHSEARKSRPSGNDSMLPNRNSSAGLTSHPALTSLQNDFISPASNVATSFRLDSAAQSWQNNTTAPSGDTSVIFIINNVLIYSM